MNTPNFPEMPVIEVSPELTDEKVIQLAHQQNTESQVIVHCSIYGSVLIDKIRIWKSTFLVAKNSEHKSKLVSAENISLYPQWQNLKRGKTLVFTLIFTGLPKDCDVFDLVEQIPEPGGFVYPNIVRNKTDVYHIHLNYNDRYIF